MIGRIADRARASLVIAIVACGSPPIAAPISSHQAAPPPAARASSEPVKRWSCVLHYCSISVESCMMHRADLIAEVRDDVDCEARASAWCIGVPHGDANEDCYATAEDCADARASGKPACVEVH